MARRKSFVYDMFPQDFNDGVKGVPDDVVGVYIKLINLMRIEGGPLPPRKLRLPRSGFDEWIRDKLGHKNVKTWRRAKRVLLGDPDKLVELPDGRVANPRTERDVAGQRRRDDNDDEQGGGNGQGNLRLVPPVDHAVDDRVDEPGEAAASGELRLNFARSSPEVQAIGRNKPLELHAIGCALPYPCIPISLHELQLPSPVAARARGDPQPVRA